MIELFEQDIRKADRQSSKGNQLKWENQGLWYKADYMGYEGLAEYMISHLISMSNLKKTDYVLYDPTQIMYRSKIYNAAVSENFLKKGWQIITLERLFSQFHGKSLYQSLWNIQDHRNRLRFLVDQVERITRLHDFGQYMNRLLTIDALFLNEDRHTHNIAVLMNEKGEFATCPVFDHGAGLLSDTTLDYPIGGALYSMIAEVKGKTICDDLEEQMEISEELFGNNLHFSFTKQDVDQLLDQEKHASIYNHEIRERVRSILYEQIRKYRYLFAKR